MSLSRHVDAEALFQHAKDHPHRKHVKNEGREFHDMTAYSSRYETNQVPKFKFPSKGISEQAAYQLIKDETELDGSPLLNLASFVHTWMPDLALKLITENISKNQCDQDEYPATMNIHTRCVSMLADLWKVPKGNKAVGTATIGSSEAISLGGLAMKKIWQEKRKAAGKDYFHPNIIMGANAQVALEKFARYHDVECRLVPVTKEGNYVMQPKDAIKFVDENTIGIFVILGSTYTGHFENVQEMSDLLDELEAKTGISVPIHVDGASGGFVAPFAYPDYKWSFNVKRVVSINTSGHKFGLTYVGLGWVLWKDEKLLHKDLIFTLFYLGQKEESYTINFSRPSYPILAQMFNFLNLGFESYRAIAQADLKNARMLSRALEASGYFKCASNIHHPLNPAASIVGQAAAAVGTAVSKIDEGMAEYYVHGLPVVAFHFSDEYKRKYPHVQQSWIQNLLRGKKWIVPNYALPQNEEKQEILRIVVRQSHTADFMERVCADVIAIAEQLTNTSSAEFAMSAAAGAQPSNSIERELGKSNITGDNELEHGDTTHRTVC